MELRFHLDEDAEARALVRALRDRGVDATGKRFMRVLARSQVADGPRLHRRGYVESA